MAVVSVFNAALVAAVLLVVQLRSELSWPTSLLVYLPQWVWLPLPVVVVIWSALARRRGLLALSLAVLCVAALTLSGYEFARGSRETGRPATHPLRIVTWNTHDEYRHVDEFRRRLLSYEPDIVCLQEAWNPAFEGVLPGWNRVDAAGIRIYSPHSVANYWEGVRLLEKGYRTWLACYVGTPGEGLKVLNVHLLPSKPSQSLADHPGSTRDYLRSAVAARQSQFEVVRDWLPDTIPVVLCGDFNTPARSSLHAILAERMTDAFAATSFGLGLTYLVRKRFPAWRIDYVWCGNGVRPVRCAVGEAYPSDHRPVIADVVVP